MLVNARILKRGGIVVNTSIGGVQFGVPPETIKDSISSGEEVPQYYIVPDMSFSHNEGLSLAEVEFPMYYNYFIKKRKTVIIINKNMTDVLNVVLQETLYGPPSMDATREWGGTEFPTDLPNLKAECEGFTKITRPDCVVTADNMIDYLFFEDGTVKIDNVEITIDEGDYIVRDNGAFMIRIPSSIPFPSISNQINPRFFEPPLFGVTCLGSSTGFDAKGVTSGAIIWVNRQGIMVDPPANCTALLNTEGIAPSLIRCIILTHCRLFQQLIRERKQVVITTQTIITSFLRKYSMVSGLTVAFIKSLFVFKPARLGCRMPLFGGHFAFHYSLHTIPCINIEVYFQSHSIFYTGDHCINPVFINGLFENGSMTQARRDYLLDFNWNHDIVLHEAGPPPIHSPIKQLAELPADKRDKLYIYHSPLEEILRWNLRPLRPGVQNTIQLPIMSSPFLDASVVVTTLEQISILSKYLSLGQVSTFLEMVRQESFNEDQLVIRHKSPSYRVYFILYGVIEQRHDGQIVKLLRTGDFFGQKSLLTGTVSSDDFVSVTYSRCFSLSRENFLAFFDNTPVVSNLINLAKIQALNSFEVLSNNLLFSDISSSLKTHIESELKVKKFTRGSIIWSPSNGGDFGVFVQSGCLLLSEPNQVSAKFKPYPSWKDLPHSRWLQLKSELANKHIQPACPEVESTKTPLLSPASQDTKVEFSIFSDERLSARSNSQDIHSPSFINARKEDTGMSSFILRSFAPHTASSLFFSLLSHGTLALELAPTFNDDGCHSSTLIALDDSTVFLWSKEDIKYFLATYPSLMTRLLQYPYYVESFENPYFQEVMTQLSSDFIFSQIPEDQRLVLVHLMFVEAARENCCSKDSEYMVRILVKGRCSLLVDDLQGHTDYVNINNPNMIATYGFQNARHKLLYTYTKTDCIFITLTKTVLSKFLVEMDLLDFRTVLAQFNISF